MTDIPCNAGDLSPAHTVADAAVRTQAWLEGALRRDGYRPAWNTRLVAAAHLCDLILRPHSAPRTHHLLAQMGVLDFSAGDLVSNIIARSAVLAAPSPDRHVAEARRYGALLHEMRAAARGSNATLLDLCLSVEGDESGASECIAPVLLRSGQIEDIEMVLSGIEKTTRFGCRPVAGDLVMTALLDGAAIAALRRYELPLAFRCIRASHYYGCAGSLAARTGREFIRASQCEAGAFGDYESVLARYAEQPDLWLRIKLPITFQALWTLAECEDSGFRLMQAAFQA